MLKRLVGVITVHNDWAVQSIGYEQYLPLGRPEIIAENYDRWQLDEIMIIDIDRSKRGLKPNFEVIEKIAKKKILTPVCYAGGIRHVNDALKLVSLGADRIGIDNLFRKNFAEANKITQAVGRQAIIRMQPLKISKDKIYLYDYLNKKSYQPLCVDSFIKESESFSELMIVDVFNEGKFNSFTKSLLQPFENKELQIICFGGISSKSQISNLFKKKYVSAAAVGNFLSYKEIPHKEMLIKTEIDKIRMTSFGSTTRGAREW